MTHRPKTHFPLLLTAILVLITSACTLQPDADSDACVVDTAYFDALPVTATSDYVGVIPMGLLDPANGDVFPSNRLYFQPYSDDPGATPPTFSEFAVTSPGKLKLSAIRVRTYTNGVVDYGVFFKPCKTMRAYLDHLSSISTDLNTVLNAAAPSWNSGNPTECLDGNDAIFGDYTECLGRFAKVTVASGDFLGTAGKYLPLGFGVYDQAVTVPYITPEHYTQSLEILSEEIGLEIPSLAVWELLQPTYSDYPHAACPLNYYQTDPEEDGFPTVNFVDQAANPIEAWDGTNCGIFLEESRARVTGGWFDEEILAEVIQDDGVALFGADRFGVALAHDFINDDGAGNRGYPIFSIGDEVPVTGGGLSLFDAGRYKFTVASSGTVNRDFNSLIAGNSYCYESLTRTDGVTAFAGSVWIRPLDANTMTFQAFDSVGDNCSNTSLDSNARTFVR